MQSSRHSLQLNVTNRLRDSIESHQKKLNDNSNRMGDQIPQEEEKTCASPQYKPTGGLLADLQDTQGFLTPQQRRPMTSLPSMHCSPK